jgi:branched-chain amino acid transport system substrate-binding protein
MRAKLTFVTVIILLTSILLGSCAPAPAATTVPPTAVPPTTAPATAVPPTAVPATKAPTAVPPTAAPTKVPGPAAIEIGGSIPLTGKYGSLGVQVKAGYEYAVADINAAGGVMVAKYGVKIPLHLTTYDDESNPTKAVTNLENLFSDQKVSVYLGGAASDMHAATVPIAEKNKVPYLGISFALWKIHQQGYKYLFSPFIKSPDQATGVYQFLSTAIAADQRPKKVAILQENTDWGIEEGKLFEAYAHPFGFDVVNYATYAPGTKDFSQLILAAKNSGAEVLLAMPNTPDGIAIVKQMSELGWTPKFTMLQRAPDGITWGPTLGKLGDQIYFYPGWQNGEKFPGIDSINTRYQKDFKRAADVLVGPAYACVQILAAAIEKAGSLDRDAIRDAIAAINMTTVIGPVSFRADGTGQVLNPLVQWINGKQELVWPADQATAKFVYPAVEFSKR